MPFVNNRKLLEIREQAKNGNEKALMILQALRKKSAQEDLDRLVNDYYNVEDVVEQEPELIESEGKAEIEQSLPPEELNPEVLNDANEVVEVPDLTSILDKEMDGLLDENEIDDTPFSLYLSNKKRDALRSRKNTDYFKAYDPSGMENYLNAKIENYKGKFNNRLRDIDRRYNDMNTAITNYAKTISEMLDDGVELEVEKANSAYNDLTENENIMGSFGRHWDENDNNNVIENLKELISMYGKNNVIAALNTLNSDNNNYRDYLNNQVDTEIGRYSRSIEKLLK